MATGADLVIAILNNKNLTDIKECVGAATRIPRAVYGEWMSDDNEACLITKEDNALMKDIRKAIKMPENLNRISTMVWHFQTAPDVHHFTVIPWCATKWKIGLYGFYGVRKKLHSENILRG